jgi:hypothetical protein
MSCYGAGLLEFIMAGRILCLTLLVLAEVRWNSEPLHFRQTPSFFKG